MNNTEEQEEPLRFFDVKEFIRTNWGTLFIVFLFSLIAVLCSAVYPYGIKWLTDDVLIQKDIGKLQLILPVMIGSIVLQLLLNYLVSYRMAKIAQSYVLRSKRNMLEGILRNTAIINNNISIHALFTTDYEKVGDLLVEIITTIMSSSLGVIIYLGALVLLNPVLTLITLILIPIVISLNVVMGNHVQKAYFEILVLTSEVRQ
ncbi:ABC transporter transmembrane domain-containing protein [uncultured Secundilactobacillus sp.]|uniref:ABC transporter transmembrane domain-containing protein n=1 Tax=uncultured Secundilactobacillus sp. TaxID=2813935 RepID=UPI002584A0C6|nr:ABC transporter transmembrane domain-containing protein [uncultured Secundilactobacillus sp.]